MCKLSKPRYEVINDYPNNKDFPLGIILEFERWNDFYWQHEIEDCQGNRTYLSDFFDMYPHLFRKMEWWENRETSELPEYVKCIKTPDQLHFPGEIYKVEWNNVFGKSEVGAVVLSTNCYVPSDEDEFNSKTIL